MTGGSGPTKTIPSRSQSSANSGLSATRPQPTQRRIGAARAQRTLERLMVPVGDPPFAAVRERARTEAYGLIGAADEHRVPSASSCRAISWIGWLDPD